VPRVLVVEHEATCPPALFGAWLEEAGCELVVCRPYAGDALPTLAEYDALLVLGGSMAATGPEAWLAPLRDLVTRAAASDVPTLGICLGHQVCAVAFGGTVEPNPRGQQLGLLDVGWTPAAAEDRLFGPWSTPRRGVQWNDDLVTRLPDDAVLLAATPHGEVQAARFAPTVWGVQWHPEATLEMIESWAVDEPGPRADAGLAAVREAQSELELSWCDLGKAFAATVTA
jgi:GMP synthase (glutamine-hydrolysing)